MIIFHISILSKEYAYFCEKSLLRFLGKIRESELNNTNCKRRTQVKRNWSEFFKKKGVQIMSTFPKENAWVCFQRKKQRALGVFEPPRGESDNKKISFKCFPLKSLSFFRLGYLTIFKQSIYFVTFLVLNRKTSEIEENWDSLHNLQNKK